MSYMDVVPWHTMLRQERIKRNLRQHELAEIIGTTALSISRWERGDHLPSSYFRVKLCALFGKSVEELGFTQIPGSLPTEESLEEVLPPSVSASTALDLRNIPFPRNPFFTGREEVLEWLHTRLADQMDTTIRAFALAGLAGIGKTQVAIEYAYRYGSEYSAVFWLTAETTASLMQSLHYMAEAIQLPRQQIITQTLMALAVQRWLNHHSDWLLIADNVEDLELLQTILPPQRTGSLLLTTRRLDLGMLAEARQLSAMDSEEGKLLLLRRAKILSVSSFTKSLSPEMILNTPGISAVTELVKFLEGIPLALDQAGAYLEETGCSTQDYLQRCQNHYAQVLAYRGRHGGTHPDSVGTTLRLAIERVEQNHPAAAELLRVCALLETSAIPAELLTVGGTHLGPVLGSVAVDAYQLDLALATLRNASLLTRSPERKILSLHRLVQTVQRDLMTDAEIQIWSVRVVRAVNAVFPDPQQSHENWDRCERLLGQALACVSLTEQITPDLPEARELLSKTERYLRERRRWREADLPLKQAVALDKRWYRSDYPTLIPLLEGRAELLWGSGQYEQAEALYQRAYTLEEQHLEPFHPWKANTLNDLGLLYWYQGKYEQAELLYKQVLDIWEYIGSVALVAIYPLCNLSALYQRQGKYKQAEALCKKALHILEQPGAEHPRYALALSILANVYRDQGKYGQAEPLYHQTLHIQETQIGRQDPETTPTFYGLATLYQSQKKYAQAAALYQQAIDIWERQLGQEHPLKAFALTGLANVYQEQDNYEQAEALYRRALFILERVGLEHPEIATVLQGLANVYRGQGKYEQARPLYQRALNIYEHRLQANHPQTAIALANFAHLNSLQKNYVQAEFLFQRALTIQEDAWGSRHCETADTFSHFAHLQEMQGNSPEAIYLYQRSLAVREDIISREHPARSPILERLSVLLTRVERE